MPAVSSVPGHHDPLPRVREPRPGARPRPPPPPPPPPRLPRQQQHRGAGGPQVCQVGQHRISTYLRAYCYVAL